MSTVAFKGQIIFCRDVEASARFYENVLGFRGEQVGDTRYVLAPVSGSADATVRILLHPSDTPPTPVEVGAFDVEDVDVLVAEVRAAGYADQAEPTDAPWGERETSIHDPDGNGLYVTGPLRARVS